MNKLLSTSIIAIALASTSTTIEAKEIKCTTVMNETYLSPDMFQYYSGNNPFNDWSNDLPTKIENRMNECISEYRAKYGSNNSRIKRANASYQYFMKNKSEITQHLLNFHAIKSINSDFQYYLEALKSLGIEFRPSYSGSMFTKISLDTAPMNIKTLNKIKSLSGNISKQAKKLSMQPISPKLEREVNKTLPAGKLAHLITLEQTTAQYLQNGIHQPYLEHLEQDVELLEKKFLSQLDKMSEKEFINDPYWREEVPTLKQANEVLNRVRKNSNTLKNLPKNTEVMSSADGLNTIATTIHEGYTSLYKQLEQESAYLRAKEKEHKQLVALTTKEYLSRSQNSKIARELNQLGYTDQILSFGKMGIPYRSTYSTLGCLGTLYSDINISQEGKSLTISYGEKGLFSFSPQYSIGLVLIHHGIQQYAITALEKHDLPAQTDMQKWTDLFMQLAQCQENLNIDLQIKR